MHPVSLFPFSTLSPRYNLSTVMARMRKAKREAGEAVVADLPEKKGAWTIDLNDTKPST